MAKAVHLATLITEVNVNTVATRRRALFIFLNSERIGWCTAYPKRVEISLLWPTHDFYCSVARHMDLSKHVQIFELWKKYGFFLVKYRFFNLDYLGKWIFHKEFFGQIRIFLYLEHSLKGNFYLLPKWSLGLQKLAIFEIL